MAKRSKSARQGPLRVLVPVDGSDCSLRALARAIETVKPSRGVVHLMNVQPVFDDYGMVPAYLNKGRHHELMRERAHAALAPAIARLKRAGVRSVVHTASGETAGAIVRAARRNGCDSIVMGTRGMGAIGGLVVGSVANKVIHLASVPVTLVK